MTEGLYGRGRPVMPLWKIAPAASPDDARWQDSVPWREVIVRADTAAMARLLAAELARTADGERGDGNETLGLRSAFEDQKLSVVSRSAGPATGPSEIGRAVNSGPSG